MINGYVSERFGYRYTVMTCLALIIAFTAIFFTAKDVIAIQVAEILCGIPWGVFQTRNSYYGKIQASADVMNSYDYVRF
jgi:SP family general alpha glucoside:H+ symporter-like MFS transporter